MRYDGPDLADVARLTGLSRERGGRGAHRRAWRVAFGGFAPGFAYLVGGDDAAARPAPRQRRAPRCRPGRSAWPATFSGVYPRESPGGWQLIGTTDVPMWDLDRDPPALLRPGAPVRFVRAAGS